ncbi:hypothetical protein K5E_02330 [Enterococcus thailandicus]|uniref:helix-turn-helix domain-containing protein n=1 Tax=Enterococcus TaxID=1350 RepID=UPI000BAF2393|nr:helix-turn-helix domain-containing protein [Enterococcus thailandicus]ASZ07536.1 hypothetical protein CK496_06310 [Enterococcus thailandicus]MDK4351123.1 helix-turn-helix domain-containing protein [Enterococcus thailandicus]MDT2733226.1 helix-turn-helix domain-containing protein [Enterococcus thailandicus]MDT2845712.1 helix-turn-helix domain-containing protein [Enterococcus thailandicus]MEA4830487.1 helix-turn-helix domain-containing protein [Enterococcus thailandicus]
MIRLLEDNYRKMEEIIRILSISDKWMTKKELAKYIGSSESTFIRYIEEIKQRWGSVFTIQTSHKLGYRLERFNVSVYLQMLTDMAQTSTNTQLLNEFIQNPGNTIEYYCDTICISRSSFARKLKQCNQVLEKYSLKIVVDQGYQLTSTEGELSLRIFVTFFFLIYYGHYALPYQLDKKEVKQLMRRNHCQLNIVSGDNSYEHTFFIMYFMVSLEREQQGFPLYSERQAPENMKIKHEDYVFLSQYLIGLDVETYQEVLYHFQKGPFQQYSYEEKKDISEKIRTNLKFNSFSQTEQLTEDAVDFIVHLLTCLYLFSRLIPFDTTELTQRATLFTRHIHFTQLHLYARLQAELHFFSALLETNLLNHSSSYIFWLLNGYPGINQSIVASKKILVVSDMGINHSQYIGNYVHATLSLHKIRSDMLAITDEEVVDYDLNAFDLIITNQPIPQTDVPSVLINDAILFSNESELLDLLDF